MNVRRAKSIQVVADVEGGGRSNVPTNCSGPGLLSRRPIRAPAYALQRPSTRIFLVAYLPSSIPLAAAQPATAIRFNLRRSQSCAFHTNNLARSQHIPCALQARDQQRPAPPAHRTLGRVSTEQHLISISPPQTTFPTRNNQNVDAPSLSLSVRCTAPVPPALCTVHRPVLVHQPGAGACGCAHPSLLLERPRQLYRRK
jgi:hypothetical protein